MARILFVSTSTTVGGAEKTLFALATLLDPKKHEIRAVVSLKSEGAYARRLREQGVRVESLGLDGGIRPWHASRLAEIIRRERPHVVHALMYQAIQLARLAKPKAGFPFKLVSSPRVNYRSRSWASLLVDRALKGRDDLLIAECEASRRWLISRMGYSPKKTVTIRNGVDLAGWAPSKIDRQKKRLSLRLGAQDVLVGAAGRLDRQKGFPVLIEAMAQLKEHDIPVKCAIFGEGPDKAKLKALIRKRELERSVWLMGETAEMPAWLAAFDVYCLPSLWEGLPNALLEAMALGLPVVASKVDGVPEAVRDGRDGVLVPPGKPAALSSALTILALDSELREVIGKNARASIAERFTLRRMLEEYEQAYDGLL